MNTLIRRLQEEGNKERIQKCEEIFSIFKNFLSFPGAQEGSPEDIKTFFPNLHMTTQNDNLDKAHGIQGVLDTLQAMLQAPEYGQFSEYHFYDHKSKSPFEKYLT